MVLMFVGNLILFFLLIIIYLILKANLKKSILFDVTYLYRFKYTISPIVIGLFNIILLSFFSIKWLPAAFLILLIPVCNYIISVFRQKRGNHEYLHLKETIEPIISTELNKQKLSLDPDSIHIRILDEKEHGKKKIEIILDVPSKSSEYTSIKRSILEELNLLLKSRYVLELLFNSTFKKKINLI